MNKIDKIILNFIFITPVVLLFCYALNSIISGKSPNELIRERDLQVNFQGRVDSLYYDLNNHNVKVAILNNGYQYQIFRMWESRIIKGDSLKKDRGSFELFIYRNDKFHKVLDYRDTYKRDH